MAGSDSTAKAVHSEPALLGVYLNDHLAGATGGIELVRRMAGADRGSQLGEALQRLESEIVADRVALLEMMAALGVPVRRYKSYLAWMAERAGRLKLNGHLLRQSPLSRLVELEALRLAVEAKAAGWRTLCALANHDDRLDVGRLDGLLARARQQADAAEELRVRTAAEVFGLG